MCQADWFDVYGQRALDHFGRITQPKVLTQDNAWRVRRGIIMALMIGDTSYYAYNSFDRGTQTNNRTTIQ